MESILAWTDRSLFLLEWHPTKPWSSSNYFASKLSASAVRITCALLFPQNSLRSDKSATFELLTFGTRLVQVLWSPQFTLPVERTHIVEENATLVHWHVKKLNVCNCFYHRLRKDRSAIIKPCLCESVVRGSTVHLA